MVKKKIALYDIDYTIISINSLVAFLFFILKKKPSRIIILPVLSFFTILWMVRIISTEKIKSVFLLLINGIDVNTMEKYAEEFVNEKIVPKIKKGALENINDFKNKGYLIVFASASFELYIKYIARYLKADYYIGTKLFIKNNKISTKIEGKNCRGREKISRILKEIPYNNINREGSIGFSDHISDKYFLDIVETFYLVKLKKWKISKTIKSSI